MKQSQRRKGSPTKVEDGNLSDMGIGTIYTTPADTFESVLESFRLAKTDLIRMNPHIEALHELEPGIPIDVPYTRRRHLFSTRAMAPRQTAYEIAKREMALDIHEDHRPGQDNPRIRLYHSTTVGGAMPDEVSWCSSFVNYCVEQAGGIGTDNKAARSWLRWGDDVEKGEWREGDIVVFWREAKTSWKGHVAFLVTWDGERPYVLGGNQNNTICVAAPYSFSHILSVRRGQ